MKNYPLQLYYRFKICSLKKKIKDCFNHHAYMSSASSRNYEFNDTVDRETVQYRKEIYKIKRKICTIK